MMRQRNVQWTGVKQIYIEGKERQTRMYQAREVCNQALPDCSRETDEMLGIDLTQEREKVE